MVSRITLWSLLLLAALAVAGCEEGETILPPDGGTGSRNLTLEVVTSNPSNTSAVEVRATVTENGEPTGGIQVTFSATNPNSAMSRFCTPNPVTTASVGAGLIGTASSSCSPIATDAQIRITATTSNPAATDSVTVTFQ